MKRKILRENILTMMNQSNTVTVTRVQDIGQFESLREDWTALLFQCENRDIFQTWEWLFAWWKNLGQENNQLWILLFHESDTLIGIAPLMIGKKKNLSIGFRWLSNLGAPNCDIGGIIALYPEKIMQELMRYLQLHKHEWDVFELIELDLTSHANQKILSVIETSENYVHRSTEKHYYIPLAGRTWEEYYQSLSKKLRDNLKRRLKRMNEIGDVTFNKYINDSLRWENFETVFNISEKSNFPDLYKTQNQRTFHKEMFELMREKDWIRIETLCIGDHPIAYQYGFCFENRYEGWRCGFDKELLNLSPGKMLTKFVIEDQIQQGNTEFDFLRGVYSYKEDWNPTYREFSTVQLYNKISIKASLGYLWQQYLKPYLQKIILVNARHESSDTNS